MGTKNRYIIFLLISFNTVLTAQEISDFRSVDSLTYSYYSSGEWNKLIQLGNYAIGKNIDYKYLRQRLGHAYFLEGKYYDAKYQFEKALSFDSYDSFSLEYLYYSYLNTGMMDYAGIFARKLNPELKKNLQLKSFNPIESIDLEYNFKFAGTINRSNPQYYRLGISSQLAYGLILYQSFSNYKQVVTIQKPLKNTTVTDKQPEYYALLKWTVSSHLLLKTAYHYIFTSTETSSGSGNLIYIAVSPVLNRISFEAYGSVMSIDQQIISQAGAEAGYYFPGRLNSYLTGTASIVLLQNDNRFLYNQKGGIKILKNLWLEGNFTLGRMTYCNDYNGLYVYNSYDPMIFRSGVTMIFYQGRKITLWANYSFERKEYHENSSYHYNQFSYLGGIKWKL